MSAARDRRARRRDVDKAQRQVRRWDRLRARAHVRPHAREQRVKVLPVQASPKRHEAGVTANFLVGEPDWDRRAGCRPGDKFGYRLVTGLRRRNRRFFHCPVILSKSRSLCPRHRWLSAAVPGFSVWPDERARGGAARASGGNPFCRRRARSPRGGDRIRVRAVRGDEHLDGTVLAALALVETPAPQAGCHHRRHVDGARFWRLTFDSNGAEQLEVYQRHLAPTCRIEEFPALVAPAPAGVASSARDHWSPESRPQRPEWRARCGRLIRARSRQRGRLAEECLGDPAAAASSARDRGSAVLERVAASPRELGWRVTGANARGVNSVLATGAGRGARFGCRPAPPSSACRSSRRRVPRARASAPPAFAAVGAGFYATIAEATAAMMRPERGFEPEMRSVARYRELAP